VTEYRPIVFGSIATQLNKKADDQHTHKWKVFVRGANNEDVSYFIKKVVFKLHESFANPNRSKSDRIFLLHICCARLGTSADYGGPFCGRY